MNDKLKQYSELYLPVSIFLSALILAGSLMYVSKGGLPFFNNLAAGARQSAGTQNQQEIQNPRQNPVEISVTGKDHIRGSLSAPVKIVEFSDLQCPFCQRFHPALKQVFDEYKGKIAWVYKHFPLTQIHSEAQPSAEAAECVAAQKGEDGFWQFIDGVFAKQDKIGPELYRELARSAGVNMGQFDSCVAQRAHKDKVNADMELGIQSGVQATPSSFVNGRLVEGAVPYETLKAAIENALNAK
ncbi:MAG: DsbA family protein [Candidatus Wildermuthbacteria bacterium]|nr:DsbA family protein [Candidatus Wildermuthbacteria bacterium]